MKQPLTPSRFRELAAAYGSAIDRWPVGDRRAARELVLREPSLRAALTDERELDGLFAEGESRAVPAALVDRLERIPDQAPQKQPFPLKPRSFWLPAVGWAVAAGVGLWLGATIEGPALAAEGVQVGEGEAEPTVLEIAAGDLLGLEETP